MGRVSLFAMRQPELPEELRGFQRKKLERNLDAVLLFADSAAVFKAEFGALTKAVRTEGMITGLRGPRNLQAFAPI